VFSQIVARDDTRPRSSDGFLPRSGLRAQKRRDLLYGQAAHEQVAKLKQFRIRPLPAGVHVSSIVDIGLVHFGPPILPRLVPRHFNVWQSAAYPPNRGRCTICLKTAR
jgi:hypothetical protein